MTVVDRSGPVAAAAHRAAVAALGLDVNPAAVASNIRLAAPALDSALGTGVLVDRDLAYGPHERHVLDVFRRPGASAAPVVVYVHGGGFVAGAKSIAAGSPFYDNIGNWAAGRGFVGVTINYRLAPENRWPGGGDDVGRAIEWLVEHVASYGGDPARIFLFGQSAGSMHVADYVVRPDLHRRHGRGLAGAVLVSCLYDIGRALDKPIHRAYYGDDLAAWAEASTLDGLVETDLPLLLTVSEFDEPEFQQQAAAFVAAYAARQGLYPPMHALYGQNHLSSVLQIGSPGDELGPIIERFMAANDGRIDE